MNIIDILWNALGKISQYRLIKTMYVWIFIVPIFVKALQNIEETARVTVFQYTFEIQLELPFSWLIFYFSALSFAIAYLIYTIRCPKIIKDNLDYSAFKQSNKGIEHLDVYIQQIGINWEDLRQEIEKQNEYFSDLEANNPKLPDGLLRKRFWAVYALANHDREFARFFSTVFYYLGFILFSVVIIQNFLFVFRYISN